GFRIRRKCTTEHLVKFKTLCGVHRRISINDLLGERRLRSFATLRKKMAAQKTHVLAAAASQDLQQFIEERRHGSFCIFTRLWHAFSTVPSSQILNALQ